MRAFANRDERETFEKYGRYMFAAAHLTAPNQTNAWTNVIASEPTPAGLLEWLSHDTQNQTFMVAVVKQVAAFGRDSLPINAEEILAQIPGATTPQTDGLGFSALFSSMRAGVSLIPSEEIRVLAKRVAQLPESNQSVAQWASVLISDVKDARD